MDKIDPERLTPEQREAFERFKARHRGAEASERERADRDRFQAGKPGPDHADLAPIAGETERLLVVAEAVEALRAARERKGLSVADVAERSGIERSAVHKLESGRQTNPTVGTLTRYASALGMEIHFTLAGPSGAS